MEMIAYHGTRKEDAESIRENGFIFTKYTTNCKNVPGDLGCGVYAYKKESYYDAASNANKIAEKYKPGKEHQVLEMIINCPENSLLDLDEEHNENKLNDYMNSAIQYIHKNYKAIKTRDNNRGSLDGIAIELFLKRHSLQPKVIKKKTYTKFDDKMKISNIRNGTELCIKDKEVVASIK
ncbi:hypothetical protein RKK46_002859 [Listeria innocua]|nr:MULTISPECIES: hypothetical protein [Listeria]MBC1846342.1 hypothetical protein [Listeria seeligeri]EAE2646071.1 hypothetical protein [Listeria monocytogenes]EAE2856606.1 hypothetical protein [Listeria monocytogenes]EAE2979535.1 hypothetical protein [Listeria monocytogenes]EAE4167961.1 hypothetical protein [Listeria monocytogenes]